MSNNNSGTGKPAVPVKKLGIATLAIMNIVAVVSLRGLPAEAEYGLSSIFYYLFAAVFFLIPVSLVAAELATGWPEKGGGISLGRRSIRPTFSVSCHVYAVD